MNKTIRRTTITITVLLLLAVIAGAVYVFITDRSGPKGPAVAAAKSAQSTPLPKPVAPGANAPEGVAVEALSSPISAGSNASLTATTNAGSACTVVVSYNGVASTDSGLEPKTADLYGVVSWTWTVGASVPAGNWPVTITCTYHGRSAVVDSSFQVTG